MLAAHHDQENLAFARQVGAAAKSHGKASANAPAKPIGTRYLKTPLKVPLNDENAATVVGKTVLGAKNGKATVRALGNGGAGKSAADAATPFGAKTGRAPLGNKTTNAKAKAAPMQNVKSIVRDIESTFQSASATHRRQRVLPAQTVKSKARPTTPVDPLRSPEREYAPTTRYESPYKSRLVVDDGAAGEPLGEADRHFWNNYLEPKVLLELAPSVKRFTPAPKSSISVYGDPILGDDDRSHAGNNAAGVPPDREVIDLDMDMKPIAAKKSSRVASRIPSTIASRDAATSLALAPKTIPAPRVNVAKPARAFPFGLSSKKPTQLPVRPKQAPVETSVAASRTTLGYNKGRTASSLLNSRGHLAPSAAPKPAVPPPRVVASSQSLASQATITPARFAEANAAQKTEGQGNEKRLSLLDVFDMNVSVSEVEAPAPVLEYIVIESNKEDDSDSECDSLAASDEGFDDDLDDISATLPISR